MPKNLSLQELRERVGDRYDPDYLVDVLGITSDDLLEAFPMKLLEKYRDGEFSEVEDAE